VANLSYFIIFGKFYDIWLDMYFHETEICYLVLYQDSKNTQKLTFSRHQLPAIFYG